MTQDDSRMTQDDPGWPRMTPGWQKISTNPCLNTYLQFLYLPSEGRVHNFLIWFNLVGSFEIKTGSGQDDGTEGDLTVELSSPEGDCKTDVLNNPGEVNFKQNALDVFYGDVLGSCRNFQPRIISSVTFNHKGTDGWQGQYIKIVLSQDKIFHCEIDDWLKESIGKSQQTFTCNLGKPLI